MALSLIDTSVWIDWLRDGKGPSVDAVEELAKKPDLVATTQPVVMEARAGASAAALGRVERILGSFTMLDVDPLIDFQQAADLYRAVRRSGHTVRSMVDCLIASVALRRSAVVVHKDCDFDRIAAVAPQLSVRSVLEG